MAFRMEQNAAQNSTITKNREREPACTASVCHEDERPWEKSRHGIEDRLNLSLNPLVADGSHLRAQFAYLPTGELAPGSHSPWSYHSPSSHLTIYSAVLFFPPTSHYGSSCKTGGNEEQE